MAFGSFAYREERKLVRGRAVFGTYSVSSNDHGTPGKPGSKPKINCGVKAGLGSPFNNKLMEARGGLPTRVSAKEKLCTEPPVGRRRGCQLSERE